MASSCARGLAAGAAGSSRHTAFPLLDQRRRQTPMQPIGAAARSGRLANPTTRHVAAAAAADKRVVWVQTSNQVGETLRHCCTHATTSPLPVAHPPSHTTMQAVLTAAVESGYGTVLSTPSTASLIELWQELAAFDTLTLQPDGSVFDADAQQVRSRAGPMYTAPASTVPVADALLPLPAAAAKRGVRSAGCRLCPASRTSRQLRRLHGNRGTLSWMRLTGR